MTGILFIVASALFHAMWNVLLKKSGSKFRFNLNMHLASVVLFAAVIALFYPDVVAFKANEVCIGLIAAVFFAGYHLLVTKAYELADVSQVYPVTTASPLFVTIWAAVFFGDSLMPMAVVGVLITVWGCFIMNGTSFRKMKLSAGVVAAFFSAFIYSFGALFDKLGVNTGNPVMYTFWMNLFMTCFFGALYLLRHRSAPVCKADRKYILLAGLAVVASSLTYRFGVMEMPISYAVAIRQISGLFGVIMGVVFFKEGCGKSRFVGTTVIITGIVLLRISM